MSIASDTELWGVFEIELDGPAGGNPFVDVEVGATITHGDRAVDVAGFYDGGGVYRVRFMPDAKGEWRYVTRSNRDELSGREGAFQCVEPSAANHGPVRVARRFHFEYADGTPFLPFGTTCYAWTHQGDALEERTLETLRASPFNKLRMCVFPKDYEYCRTEPPRHAFERLDSGELDLARFDPDFFRHLEARVGDLRDIGVEADVILFHPYDRWGYGDMPPEADDRYLRYVVARLAASRNVWWSMANEFDIMRAKTTADWDRFFEIVRDADHAGHLRSIHNCREFYDHAKPWVTHLSVQREPDDVRAWRERYGKPVVVDETKYEGDIPHAWGAISARELVHRFWVATCHGGYCGHGETYLHPEDLLWWSKGGELRGESPARIAFLREILEDGPGREGLGPSPPVVGHCWQCAGAGDGWWLCYSGIHQPGEAVMNTPEGAACRVELVDPWEMQVLTLAEGARRGARVALPSRPYVALRIARTA